MFDVVQWWFDRNSGFGISRVADSNNPGMESDNPAACVLHLTSSRTGRDYRATILLIVSYI